MTTLKTPVAFLIFNRPEATEKVFAQIAKAKPQKLLVVADGPRADRQGDEEKCLKARAVINCVDWDCEVLTNYAESNLGCRRRVSTGLDWVFDTVEEAIILEDDCLPHPSFFPYCEELLERYRHEERVMNVSGDNFLSGKKELPYSYYFSHYPLSWGWASWRRAWRHFNVEIRRWPDLRDTSWLVDIHRDAVVANYWTGVMDQVFAGEGEIADTWDYQWAFACWTQNGLSITPAVNLVSNIGFTADATHLTRDVSPVSNLPASAMPFPLRHPPLLMRDPQADQLSFDHMCFWVRRPSIYRRVRRKVAAFREGLRQSANRLIQGQRND